MIDQFLEHFIPAIDGLKWGLPWEAGVAITPLPEPKKPQYLRDLIVDAKAHGARVVNEHLGGGKMHGNYCSALSIVGMLMCAFARIDCDDVDCSFLCLFSVIE